MSSVRRVTVLRKTRGRRSRFGWAVRTVSPWCLAALTLFTLVSGAGLDPFLTGASRVAMIDRAPDMPDDLVPSAAGLADWTEEEAPAVVPVHLVIGEATELDRLPEEKEPRAALKAAGLSLPAVNRDAKGDPVVPLRPTFETGLRSRDAFARYQRFKALFTQDEVRAGGFATIALDESVMGDLGRLEPMPPDVSLTTRRSQADRSPQASLGSTTPHVQDGSTPIVPRAVSLASSTPLPLTPVEIAALPKFSRGPGGLVTSNRTVVGIAPYHPDYQAMIASAKSEGEQRCLAEAVYFEARSEPEEGQAAVAQVVLNRVMSGLYPSNVCGVVFQNYQHHNACQFSFACEGHGLRITEADAWARAVRIAREVTEGATYVSDVGGATHYHADYVRPGWARQLTKMDVIGRHVFYKLKPGQT